MEDFKNNNIIFLAITFIIIVIDQISKYLAVAYFAYSKNTGAVFGILQGTNTILIFISLIIIGAILFLHDRIISEKNKLLAAASSFILGGAVGNIIDRIFLGYVIDFIDLKFWPSFNISDSALTIGVVLLIIYFLKKK